MFTTAKSRWDLGRATSDVIAGTGLKLSRDFYWLICMERVVEKTKTIKSKGLLCEGILVSEQRWPSHQCRQTLE